MQSYSATEPHGDRPHDQRDEAILGRHGGRGAVDRAVDVDLVDARGPRNVDQVRQPLGLQLLQFRANQTIDSAVNRSKML